MLRFMLDEMVQDPLRRHVVLWQGTSAAELPRAHVAEDGEQAISHESEPFEVSVKRLGEHRRETAIGVACIGREEGDNVSGIGLVSPQHLGIEPIELDQRDMIEQRANAVAAFGWRPVQNGLRHAGYGSQGLLTRVFKDPQPAPDIGIAAIVRDYT
jgi:hypothetical protein